MSWRLQDETGATLVIIAMSLVALIGLVGLALDGGSLFVERRQLQSAADAAALAVAEDCARGRTCNSTTGHTTAEAYAADNSPDGATTVDAVTVDLAEQTVRVDVSALDDTGTPGLAMNFMRVLGIHRVDVAAHAIVRWSEGGFPPIAISVCETLADPNDPEPGRSPLAPRSRSCSTTIPPPASVASPPPGRTSTGASDG